MVKFTRMFVMMFVFATVGGSAVAQSARDIREFENVTYDRTTAPDEVDMEEAIFFGEFVDSSVDEYGIAWDYYWDAEQQVMWATTAGNSREEALEHYEADPRRGQTDSFSEDGFSGEPEGTRCTYTLMAPYGLAIYPGSGFSVSEFFSFSYSTVSGIPTYTASAPGSYDDISGYVWSVAKNVSNYCNGGSTYLGAYYDYNGGGAGFGWKQASDDTCGYNAWIGKYAFHSFEDADIDGGPKWDYGGGGAPTLITRHYYFACGLWRTMQFAYHAAPVK